MGWMHRFFGDLWRQLWGLHPRPPPPSPPPLGTGGKIAMTTKVASYRMSPIIGTPSGIYGLPPAFDASHCLCRHIRHGADPSMSAWSNTGNAGLGLLFPNASSDAARNWKDFLQRHGEDGPRPRSPGYVLLADGDD